MIRLATFNVENLFSRAKALNQETWAEGKVILDQYGKLTKLLEKSSYSTADKEAIKELLIALGLKKSDESPYVLLRQNKGKLVKRPTGGGLEIVADHRSDWIGWLELKKEAVNEIATKMTARVIAEVNADILGVVEAEDRIALLRFNEQLLKPTGIDYPSVMLIDGNDERGIDVGIMAKAGIAVESIVSHVDDSEGDSRIFSRDCPEFTVSLPDGTSILVLVNHFKSKGYGAASASNARRKLQAERCREIYDQRVAEGVQHIAIMGDFNDTPDSEPLKPLLKDGSTLKDVFKHPTFVDDGRPGTYANGTASNKIDYLLLSPSLFGAVTSASVFRKGVWGGVNGTLFPHFDEMTKAMHAASDHAAVVVDIDLG